MGTSRGTFGWMQALAAGLLLAVSGATLSQPYGYGQGMGPGMGPGMMGQGMMGMGPGMMGQGMMGMGPGMMGGCGMMGMGPGMMSGLVPDLDQQQRSKIAHIQEEARRKQWDLADKAREEQYKLQQLYYADKSDPAAIGAQYKRVQDIHQQMVQLSAETQNGFESVLRPEQRQQVRRYWRGGMMCGW